MWCGIAVPFVFIFNFYYALSLPINKEDMGLAEKISLDFDMHHNFVILQTNAPNKNGNQNENIVMRKTRVKRQGSGAGKFSEAAQMTEIKNFRLFLQMFKNLWASSHVGGSHPMHQDVPKPVILLFKQKVMEFFFPPVGEDAIKE